MLTCWRRKKNCTLSYLKTQGSSLLNPEALDVATLNVARRVKELGGMRTPACAALPCDIRLAGGLLLHTPSLAPCSGVHLSLNPECSCHFQSFCVSLANSTAGNTSGRVFYFYEWCEKPQ